MFSLQKLLGKEDKFFDLLEASAREAQTSVQALICVLKNPCAISSLDDFARSRRNEKAIASQISDALCTTFITAFEREDIESLSQVLYRIPKTVEKIGERMLLAPQLLEGVDLNQHICLLQEANVTLLTMIQELRKGINMARMRELNAKLQLIEGDADKLMLQMLNRLFAPAHDPLKAIFLKDIFELLEKVVDRYRDAGNVIYQIVIKNS